MADDEKDKSPPEEKVEVKIIRSDLVPPANIRIIPMADALAFPGARMSIQISSPELAAALIKEKFAVIVHTFSVNDPIPEIGTIGFVEQGLVKKDGSHHLFSFIFLRRVKISSYVIKSEKNWRIISGAWEELREKDVTEEVWSSDDFRVDLNLLLSSLTKLLRGLNGAWAAEYGEIQEGEAEYEASRKSKKNITELAETLTLLQNVDKNTIGRILDSLGDLFIRMVAADGGEEKAEFLEKLRKVLWAAEVPDRLDRAADFAVWFYTRLEDAPDAGQGLESPQNQKGEITRGISPLEEELRKPREVKIRFPISEHSEIPEGPWICPDPEQKRELHRQIMAYLDQYLVDQVRAKELVAGILVHMKTGLADPVRPQRMLLCGPTGVGKTEMMKALASFFFDDPSGYVHIPGNILQLEHAYMSLLGAPASYVGYGEDTKFSQWSLDKAHFFKQLKEQYRSNPEELAQVLRHAKEMEGFLRQGEWQGGPPRPVIVQELMRLGWMPGKHPALVLMDEMEKAHQNVTDILLRVHDDGILQLMNGETTFFGNTILVYTANIYGREIADKIAGRKVYGIRSRRSNEDEDAKKALDEEIYRETLKKIQETLRPEFFGRIGKEYVCVLHPLGELELLEVLERMDFPALAARIKEKCQVDLFISGRAKHFLVRESCDPVNRALGARAILAILERKVEQRLAGLLDAAENGGLVAGDTVLVDTESEEDGSGEKITILIKQRSS